MSDPNTLSANVPEATQPDQVTSAVTTGASHDVGALYEEYRDLLLFIACRKFRIGEGDAENLIQEVFLAYMQNEAQVENTRSWLVASMCNASRAYWRTQARTEALPDDIDDQSDPMTHATPVVGTILGERQAIFFTQKGLVSVVPKTGKVLWRYAFPYSVSTAASPVCLPP